MAIANTVTATKACFPIPSSHLHLHSCLMTQQHLYNPIHVISNYVTSTVVNPGGHAV